MKRLAKLLSLSTVVIAMSCTQSGKSGADIKLTIKNQKGEPLAHVGDTVLTLEELSNDFLDRQGTFRGAPHLNTEKKRIDYVENAVTQRALFLEGISLNLLDDPSVKRDLEKIVVQKLIRDKLAKVQEEYKPTEEEIKKHYDENPNLYNRQEAAKVAYFAIPFGDDKNNAQKLAQALLKDAKENVKNANIKEFARLAMKHAQQNNGKMKISLETNESSFLEKSDFEAKFGKESFDIINKLEKVGEMGPLLTTENSYFVVMKTGYRKALNESIEEAKPKIEKRIAFDQRGKVYENYVNDLRKKYNVKINQEKIAELGKGVAPLGTAQAQIPQNGGQLENMAQKVPAGSIPVQNVEEKKNEPVAPAGH